VSFELTDTHQDIQKAAREFAEKEFDLDLALELEKERRFPKSIFEKACQLGFIGVDYPESYGGQSLGLFENVLVIEEFTRKDSGIGISLSLADMGSSIILKHGDEDQKKKFVIPVTKGKATSTVATLTPTLRKNGESFVPSIQANPDGYHIERGETCVIHGSSAHTLILLCEDPDPEKSLCLIVEKDSKGLKALGLKKMMGMRLSSIDEMAFDHVKIPRSHAILWNREGVDPLTTYRRIHRIKTSAQALGIAQGAFEQAMKHAREREQFGKKIVQFQGIQFMLAELYTLIEAARGLVYRAARDYDVNAKEVERNSSVAKLFATDVAVRTTIDSIQIHGGVGLMREYSIERMFRDAKTIQNLEESDLVQKALIAKRIVLS